MESNYVKYKDHIFSRFFIIKEGLFKNTKKLLNIYKDSVIIENIDETEREIINYEDIINVIFVEGNIKNFKIQYKTNKNSETTLTFSSSKRTEVISDLLRQIDLFSKINKHPVESFKCYMFFDDCETVLELSKSENEILSSQAQLRINRKSSVTYMGKDITLNLYRSIIEFIPLDSKREIRIRFSDIENLTVYDNTIIKFELYNKIDLFIMPKNASFLKTIIEKLLENCRNFLDHEVQVNYHQYREISKSWSCPKTKLFSFSKILRILYNSQSLNITLTADYDYLYEIYENIQQKVIKINKIMINDIRYIIMYESNPDYLEIVTITTARYLYQVNNMERNIIVTHLIDLMSNKEEAQFLLLPAKPKYGMKIIGFTNDEVDWEYEKQLFVNLNMCFSQDKLRERIAEDICLNFCFKSEKFKQEPIVNKKIYQAIYELIPEELNKLDEVVKFTQNEMGNNLSDDNQSPRLDRNKSTSQFSEEINIRRKKATRSMSISVGIGPGSVLKSVNSNHPIDDDILGKKKSEVSERNNNNVEQVIKKLYIVNIYLILCKDLIIKSQYDKIISDILNYVEHTPICFQTLFFNAISIFKNILPPQRQGILKKDEIAQRKWMISSHFDNGIKIKKMLFSKIFEINSVISSVSVTESLKGLNSENNFLQNQRLYPTQYYGLRPNNYTTSVNRIRIPDFEEKNILSIYILMELQKEIYEFCKEINIMSDILKEFNQFDFLYILYMLMRGKSNIMKQISMEILIILLKNLSIHQEYNLKNIILSRTLIFFILLNIYLKSPNDIINILACRFLKSFLISHVEATTLMLNLFPMTIFYAIDKKPNPINWLDHEWDNFFKIILNDSHKEQLIWNQLCRNELFDFISKKIENYEQLTEDNLIVLAFHLDNDEKEKEIPSYNPMLKDEGASAYLKAYSGTTGLEGGVMLNSILKSPINCSFYCLNYKEIKMEYMTLKKHVFVWQYYLKRIINETGRPNLSPKIDKPKKFWKKLMSEITISSNESKLILIIKTLTLLYKFYFEIIGVFKEYDYFLRLFTSNKSLDVKIIIIQMFLVTVELEEKEIKEPNLKNLIELKAPEYFLKFIPELIKQEYLKNSVEKTFTLDSILSIKDKPSSSFLDNKTYFIKNLMPDDSNFDKKFANYTNYINIDDSWATADKNIKTCTIIIRLFKLLLKRFSVIDEKLQKINYPLPKIRCLFYDNFNFKVIISLLYAENENLVIETLDLILNYIYDPLSYKQIAYKTNLIDLLIFYMIKYKSRSIMKCIENDYYYHNLFFDFSFLLKNLDKVKLNEDEVEFFVQYPDANKFLIRYFPINLIYFYISTDFQDFIKILFEETDTTYLMWNKQMLGILVENLRNYFFKNFEVNHNYDNKDKIVQNDDILKINFDFNEAFKISYPCLEKKIVCFLYFIDENANDPGAEIDESHVNIFSKCLLLKIKKECKLLCVQFERLASNNFPTTRDDIGLEVATGVGAENDVVNLVEDDIYNKLEIYLKALNNILKNHGLLLGDFTSSISIIINNIIEKENFNKNDLKLLDSVLNCIYISVSNVGEIYKFENASTDMATLHKLLIFFLKIFYYHGKETCRKDIRNIIKSIIEILRKVPKVLENICYYKVEVDDLSLYLDILSDLMHKIIFKEILEKKISIEDDENDSSLNQTLQHTSSDINLENLKIISSFFDLYLEYSNNMYSCSYLITNGLFLEIILFCLFYKSIWSDIEENLNNLAIISIKVLGKILYFSKRINKEENLDENKKFPKNIWQDTSDAIYRIFDKQLLKDLYVITAGITSESVIGVANYKKVQILENLSTQNYENILLKIKSEYENPEYIWNSNLRLELQKFILSNLKIIYRGNKPDYLNKLNKFEYLFCKNELKVGGIYVRIYNKDPSYILSDPDNFLEKVKEMIISMQTFENIPELINSISNSINNSKSNENLILNDEKFLLKFYKLLKIALLKCEYEFTNDQELKSDGRSYESFSEFKDKILTSSMNLLETLSLKSNSLKFVINPMTFFLILNIIQIATLKDYLEPAVKILRNVLKFPEFVEKINLSIFLFFLKKEIQLKEITTKHNKDSLTTLRLNILKIIKKFILNEKVGFAIKGLFEFYLPLKIIDNLFYGSGSKEITDLNLTWIDLELELPDLIWNKDAMNQSKKLLEDDCNFILNDEKNLENFPQNLLTHKLGPHKTFFFEIVDEFKIDNIYIRIFNKDPAYNIGRNLILFLKHVTRNAIDTMKVYNIMNFYFDNNQTKAHIRLSELIRHKFISLLTAMSMIIEQIYFNDFNENLGISSPDEMKNFIKDEDEKNLLNLVQRSFEFSKLLSNNMIKKIIRLNKIFFGLDENLYNNFTHFDNNMRLVYLQIIYLIACNKNGLNLISDNFNILDVMEKMNNNQDKIGDFEFVVVICLFTKIISNDISHISGFLTSLFDKYVELSNKRSQLLKYVQLIFCKIINDTQYGDSLVNSIKIDPIKYKNFPITIAQKLVYYDTQVSQIWRKAPDSKDQANIIYKINHQTNFVDENIIKSCGSYQNFEMRFPFLPKLSTTYFNVNDINQEEIIQITEKCFSFTNLEL